MRPSFNLIDQPFVPCIRFDGSPVEYGLRDALLRAHEVAAIWDASPLVTVALHRLMLAILHRCYDGPRDLRERVDIKKVGAFDRSIVSGYLDRWGGRFDLFDQRYPFYQDAGYAPLEPDGMNRLARELSRGNNALLFDHTTDASPPLCTPARAARLVIAEQAYAVGGGKSGTGHMTHAPLVTGVAVLAQGASLFETLWLNLTVFDGKGSPVPSGETDSPVWERQPAAPALEPGRPRGYLDYLTWQARTIRLRPEQDGGGIVRRVSYAQGRRLELPQGFYDPMMAYTRGGEYGELPVRLTERRDPWRDTAALFQFIDTDELRGPTTLRMIGDLVREGVLPRSAHYRASVFGMCTDQAKVNFWRHQSLPLPLACLTDEHIAGAVRRALALAEAAASESLRAAAWATAVAKLSGQSGTKPDAKQVRALVDSFAPERAYWLGLGRPFRRLVASLTEGDADPHTCLREWFRKTIRPAALAAFDGSAGRARGGRDLAAVSTGRAVLFARLRAVGERDLSSQSPGNRTVKEGVR